MNILIVKTKKSPVIEILIYTVGVLMIIAGSLYFYYDKKVKEPIRVEAKHKKIMSNISVEINRIKNLLPSENIIELKFENNYIYIKLKPGTNIEPLITRYEDMLKIKYTDEYTLMKIKKKEIMKKVNTKEDVYDYLLNKDVILKKLNEETVQQKDIKSLIQF